MTRRHELSDFLRSRRARLNPRDVGLHNGGRRRTPGLRREEVATLANVSVTWYTWLEQGRPITVTTGVLDSISTTLRLDETERAHFYRLAGHVSAIPEYRPGECTPAILDTIIYQWMPNPAYIIDRYWRLVTANAAARRVLGPADRNHSCLQAFDADSGPRDRLHNWSNMAPNLVAEFRYHAAHYPADPEFARIIANLRDVSAEFAELWRNQDVRGTSHGVKEVEHPDGGGVLSFHVTTMHVNGHPDLQVVFLTPIAATDTAERLHALVRSENT